MQDVPHISGDLTDWPSKDKLASILQNAGLRLNVGRYAIRVENCSHFVFRELEGDIGGPCITADADTVEEILRDAKLVSGALAQAGIRHSFEIYDESSELVSTVEFAGPS